MNQTATPAALDLAKPFAWIATDLDGRADVGMTKEEAKRRAGEGCTEFIPLYDIGSSSADSGDVSKVPAYLSAQQLCAIKEAIKFAWAHGKDDLHKNLQSIIDRAPFHSAAGSEQLCPACQGSGEGLMMEGAGPDAYEVPCNCPYCNGSGGLLDAYHGLVALLDAEREKYLGLCGKQFFAEYAPQQAAPEAPTLDLQNDIDMVKGALDLCEPDEQQAFQRILAAMKGANRG